MQYADVMEKPRLAETFGFNIKGKEVGGRKRFHPYRGPEGCPAKLN